MDAKTLFKLMSDEAIGWRFNHKYWTKCAWNCDATTLIEMLHYLTKLHDNPHWHCFYKVAKHRGVI